MLSLSETIRTADRLASQAWRMAEGPTSFRWRDGLCVSAGAMAQFVAANPHASAEPLYLFCVAGEVSAAAWADLPPPQRVSLEIFLASFLALAREMECSVLAPSAAHQQPGSLLGPSAAHQQPGALQGPSAAHQQPGRGAAKVVPLTAVSASPELKRSPLVTGHVRAVDPAPEPQRLHAPGAEGRHLKAQAKTDPLAELLDRRMTSDTGRPAKKGAPGPAGGGQASGGQLKAQGKDA